MAKDKHPNGPVDCASGLDRRALMVGCSLTAAALVGGSLLRRCMRRCAPVFLAARQRYDHSLVQTIHDGLVACGLRPADVRGKRVLLKPNLVEPTRAAPHVTTHPTMVLSAAEVFRSWGAEVVVGEGPGHVRDTEMALVESGMGDAITQVGLPFEDLNYGDLGWAPNAGQASKLAGFFFPRAVMEADFVVSMPKMKTHHWIGVTASMKNLYGVIPGVKYGWPKNVLHYAGIPETVYDINASLPRTLAIVDGIQCMQGDGPIMGDPMQMDLVVIGQNLPAVDATVSRLMRLDPARVHYLALAANRLGPIDDSLIEQRGERWSPWARPFEILDLPHLDGLRGHGEA